jgi:hypothetical protein
MFVTLMLIFEISRASFLISCFSLKISCEIKKISWQHAAMLADFLMPCHIDRADNCFTSKGCHNSLFHPR